MGNRTPTDPPSPVAIHAAHDGLVWSVCRRLSPDPEDAYQEVWEKVFRALPAFDPSRGTALAAYILTIAHRHLVDRHRRARVRGEVLQGPELAAHGSPPEEILQARLDVGRLEALLATLPAEQRRVVVLHHVYDQDLETIAASEGVAVGTVKSRLHRARAALLDRWERS